MTRQAELLIMTALKNASFACGLAVKVSVNGRTQFRGAYGMKDLENMVEADRTDVSHFAGQVWSVSKPFTAHFWMKFLNDSALNFESRKSEVHHVLSDYPRVSYVERKNLVLSDENFPVIEYFPVKLDELRNLHGPVKLAAKHFLVHMAGIDLYPEDDHDFKIFNSSTQWFKRYVGSYAKSEFQPVTMFSYSNIGYDLIGVMLERLQANKFTDYGLAQLASLNITSTDFHRLDHVYMGEFSQYDDGIRRTWSQSNATAANLTLRSGSARLISNVDDLDKFGNITARMYKQAFIDTTDDMQKLPLFRDKIREQYSMIEPEGYNKGDSEWEDYAAGWGQSRQLVNNHRNQRCLRVLVNHAGLGNGVCAYLGVGMHDLDVDRDAEKPAEEQDPMRQRQMDPVRFDQGAIPHCYWKTPVDEEMITRWELPSKTQMMLNRNKHWDLYGDYYFDGAKDRLEDELNRYQENAQMLLYLMIDDPLERTNYNQRLIAMQACWKRYTNHEEWKIKRVEHKIWRQFIREHWRRCRKEPDSLDKKEYETLLERVEMFMDYRRDVQDAILSLTTVWMVPIENIRKDIEAHFQQNARVNEEWLDIILRKLKITDSHRTYASYYDIDQPFNKLKSEHALPNNYGNDDENTGADVDRFETVELNNLDRCSCGRLSRLEARYPEQFEMEPPKPDRKDAQDNPMTVDVDAMTGTVFYDRVNCDSPKHILPRSWLSPTRRVVTRQHSNDFVPPKKRQRTGPAQKSVVVSVICNQNAFNAKALGRDLDALFGQHFFHTPPPPPSPPPSPPCAHQQQEHLCDICNRSCKSKSGLASHKRACRKRSLKDLPLQLSS